MNSRYLRRRWQGALENQRVNPSFCRVHQVPGREFWGTDERGSEMSEVIMGSPRVAVVSISGNGTPEQVMGWVPQCYGTADDVMLGAFYVSEP